ncbi:hypothetical protein BB558_000916 [Smittium angustum]|uniref:Meiotic nuclear division protein 1 n=1 Tax=Smittium angustum TaxID=133377 RepID=A0A2U1JD19_SMIAN|nr:hypothetical protein BB558_000916 [Smittium angustum]
MTKRMSAEDKQKCMLDLFYEKKSFFQLKELEKMGSKEKKISLMTIKDTLQALVDDGLAHLEKIGTSNYYWAFPSEGAVKRRKKLQDLEKTHNELQEQKSNLEKAIEEGQKGKEQTATLEEELAALEAIYQKDTQNIERFKECDPETLRGLQEKTKISKAAANRWTDNTFILQSWCRDKFNIDQSDFNKQFGIKDDFDNIP